MKKLLLILMLFCVGISANAAVLTNPTKKEDVHKITKISYTLLNANRIPQKVTFTILEDKLSAQAVTHYRDNTIGITSGLIKVADSDDEIAGVLAHEISHAVDYRQGTFKGYFSIITTSLTPEKYEYKADKRAVDYMVKAGYNPLGLITILNKIGSQYRYDWLMTHPLTTRRMAEIYEYVYSKYPEYLVQNEYQNNIIYQNFLLTSRENRQKLEKKIKSNSSRKVNYL